MEATYDFGMIGIGVMGSNLLLNIADHGFSVIGYDLVQERVDRLERAATSGTSVKGTTDIKLFIQGLKRPRKIMVLVPAGAPVDTVINELLPLLEEGDIIIEGGNSFYQDTQRRINSLQPSGIHFFGMGVSGGEAGARSGPSLMPGGDKAAYEYLRPILEAVAAEADGKPCVAYMGNGAAGHYVKMVHNGIEYAMMQMISEAYHLLKRARFTNDELHHLFSKWNAGSLQSYLIQITADIFTQRDTEGADKEAYLIDKILDKAGSKGTGKWTSQEAMNLSISTPTIDMAVAMRDLSIYKAQRVQASSYYRKASITSFEKEELATQLEEALYFCFVMAYAQGLSLLAQASVVHQMQIPLADVVQVWKGGCIIRAGLLYELEKAFASNPELPNLLLDKSIADVLQSKEEATRHLLSFAIASKVPVAAMSSALAYFDAYTSEHLPLNLIQAQRDYFGAHTYQRIDKEGSFHTEWQADPIRQE
jgi:6-phosphogluconate dehydrogenase